MRYLLAILLAAAPLPAFAQDGGSPPAILSGVDLQSQVIELFNAGRAEDAIALIDPVLADFDRRFGAETRGRYCEEGSGGARRFAKDAQAGGQEELVMVSADWCFALWAKGYALVDVRRIREAVPYLERAAAMSPENTVYLSELGNAYQELRRWEEALDVFTRSAGAAERLQGRDRAARLGRAWRGMGFCLIELGRWDEAEGWFRKALELDPNDRRAQNELEYIRQNRP